MMILIFVVFIGLLVPQQQCQWDDADDEDDHDRCDILREINDAKKLWTFSVWWGGRGRGAAENVNSFATFWHRLRLLLLLHAPATVSRESPLRLSFCNSL